MRKRGGFLSFLLKLVGVFLVYFLAGQVGLSFAFFNPSASPIWPPTAIALAAFLLLGYRIWPAIFLGAFLFNLNVNGDFSSSFLIGLGNTLEGVVGCLLVNRFARGIHAFEKPLSILQFTLWAGFISTLVSATIGVTSLVALGLTPAADYFPVWTTWWLGDVTGNLVFAPFFILWFQKRVEIQGRVTEGVLLVLALLSTAAFVFLGSTVYPLSYLSIPAVVWAAFRFGPKASSATVFILSIIAVFGTSLGLGPFASDNPDISLLLLQMFLGVISITNLILSAIEAESKQGEQRFRSMNEQSTEAIALVDSRGLVLYASPSTYTVLKIKSEKLIGNSIFEYIFTPDRQAARNRLTKVLKEPERSFPIEFRMVKPDGSIIWVESTSKNKLDDPTIRAIVMNYRDVSRSKRITTNIQEEKARDEAVLESIGEGVIATDELGRVIRMNAQAKQMLGYTDENLIGKYLLDVVSMQDESGAPLPIEKRPIEKILKGAKKSLSHEYYCVRQDGSRFPTHLSAAPIYFKKKLIGAVEVMEDITHEKEIDKAKTEFISLASHQLRTPLTVIKWVSEILTSDQKKKLSKDQQKNVKEILYATNRMVSLVNGLLNVSRIEFGTFPVEPRQMDMQVTLDVVLHEFAQQIKQKKLHIEKEIEAADFSVEADPNLVHICMQNLISNAIKYCAPKKTILVSLKKQPGKIIFSVTDQGVGIPKGQQKKVFSKLFRADNAKEVEPDGTGLGLYLVKSILDAVGGRVEFQSEEQVGSTFTITFPDTFQKKRGKKGLVIS